MAIKYRSEEINFLLEAFSKAQGAYKKLIPNEILPSGKKYANLDAIKESIKEAFALNGLSFFQITELLDEGAGAQLLYTTIGHSSGQFMSSLARIVMASTIQEDGNRTETRKRIQALMILGIAPSPNDPTCHDDDGQQESDIALIAKMRTPEEERSSDIEYQPIGKSEYTRLLIEIGNDTNMARDILKRYNINSLQDMPLSKYQAAIEEIRRIKRIVEDSLHIKR